jgi:hypothetical protein
MSYNIGATSPFTTSTTKLAPLGAPYRNDSTGRAWHYALNASSIGPGKLVVAATPEANHIDLAPAAAATGVRQITVTLGATAATANQYQDGWAVAQDNTGEGRAYRIEGHPAAALSTALVVDLAEALTVAVDTTTDFDLVKNRYDSVVISVTDQQDPPAGVFNVTVGTGAYAYVQTWGPAAVWHDAAVNPGVAVAAGTGTAGQAETAGAGDPEVAIHGPVAGADTDYQMMYLTLEP